MQLWKCRACGRVFTPAPPALRHKTYPLAIILDGVTLYNLGHTLAEATAKLKMRHVFAITPSTLSAWIGQHRELTTYARLREAGRRIATPAQAIRTVKLYHRQVYEYACHRPKLALLADSAEHARFAAGLSSFLEAVPKLCPHNLFTASLRASQTAGLRLFDIKCAWFNEDQYCEFFPRTVLAHTK